MFDHLLELSDQDDSNKLSNIGFGEEIAITKEPRLSGALNAVNASVTNASCCRCSCSLITDKTV